MKNYINQYVNTRSIYNARNAILYHRGRPAMRIALGLVLALGMAMGLVSCGGEKGTPAPVETDSIVAPPTVMPDTFREPEPEPVPEVKLGPVHSADEVLAFMNASPDSALYAEGVIGLIAKDSPSYAKKLLKNTHERFIVADKGSLRVYLYDRWGRELKRYRMCAGKGRGTKKEKGDSRTPEGFFTVEGIYDSTDWLFTDDDGVTSKVKGQFGPRFVRLRTPVSLQIGIHGTCAPWSLGARTSHGCMRLSNESILELVEYVEPGMPVIVNPSNADQAVNEEEGNDVTRLKLYVDPTRLPAPLPQPEAAADSTATDSTSTALPQPAVRPDSIR